MKLRTILFMVMCIVFVVSAIAQTNIPPVPPDGGLNLPQGKEAIWLALIPPITFTITWAVGKIPALPKEILPWITPVVGVLLGIGMKWATDSHWPWWSSAGAGAIAVAIFEAAKGLTKAGPDSALTPTPQTHKG